MRATEKSYVQLWRAVGREPLRSIFDFASCLNTHFPTAYSAWYVLPRVEFISRLLCCFLRVSFSPYFTSQISFYYFHNLVEFMELLKLPPPPPPPPPLKEFSCMNTMRTAEYAAVAASTSKVCAFVNILMNMVKAATKTVIIVSRICRLEPLEGSFDTCCSTHNGPRSMPNPRAIVMQVTALFIRESLL